MARRLEPVRMAHGKMVQPALPHKMVRRHARVVAFAAILATAAIPIMARFVVKMYPMDPSRMIAAQLVVLLAAMDTISQATAVWLINARIAQSNVMGEPHRRVPAVYGMMAQHVQRIRFVAEAVVQPVLRVNMSMKILAKTIALQIVERMGIHAPKIMRRRHVRMAHVLIHAMPTTAM